MGTPITDPAELEACRFLCGYYDKLGTLAPAQFSVEEQHALTVLAAYVRARGEPVAWRWRFVREGKPSGWYVSHTPRESKPATKSWAAIEVVPLYAAPEVVK